MNKRSLMYFSALFFLLLVALLIFTTQKEGNQSMFKNINVEEARKMVKENDVFVLDVRTPAEFNSSHLEGATLIPVNNAFGSNLSSELLLEARKNEVPENKKVLVYCRTGHRSTAASTILAKAGYSQVYNMGGGINAWVESGYPVVN